MTDKILPIPPSNASLLKKHLEPYRCKLKDTIQIEYPTSKGSSWPVLPVIFATLSLALDLRILAFTLKHNYPQIVIAAVLLGTLIGIAYTFYLYKLRSNTLFYKLKFNSDGLEVYKGPQKVSSYKWEDVDSLIIDLSSTRAYALRFKDNKRVLLPATWSPQLKIFLSCLLYHQPRLAGQIEEYVKTIYPSARIED